MDQSTSPSLLVSDFDMNKNEADYLSLLLAIIESKNWAVLQCAIDGSPATFQHLARKVARAPDLNGMSM
jgi:hypothetical protein